MAFSSILRRAPKSLIPFAVRSVGTSGTFHGAIPNILVAENHTSSLRHFLPLSHFSTGRAVKPSADENLIRVLETEIACGQEPSVENIPNEFPFKIEDNPGQRTISLTRTYQDETIRIEVDMPNTAEGDEKDDDDDDDDDKDDEESVFTSIPLVVSISKGSGQYMEFGITAMPDKITIDSLSIKNPEISDDQLTYEGPDFNDLDENLQNAFHKYLDIRGIKPSFTNILFEYMANKDNKEYLLWLKNLKDFVQK